ncbi:MAG: response regulator transcription factor [Actinomycetota bacterium]
MTKRVLVVEDDEAVSHMIAQILRADGYESTVAAEGRSALAMLRPGSFDLVILDVMLPGMDGISILKSIREEPSLNAVPVLMLSAKTDDATTWAGWRAGCDYYMTKPFDPDELLSILKRLEPARTP